MIQYACGHIRRSDRVRPNCPTCTFHGWYHDRGGKEKIRKRLVYNKERIEEQKKGWKCLEPKRRVQKEREFMARMKARVIQEYGGACACCGEAHIDFLQIDHINGGGREHRRQIGNRGTGGAFYSWLKKHGYPDKDLLRVLCANCNFAVRYGKTCPHEFERVANAMLVAV